MIGGMNRAKLSTAPKTNFHCWIETALSCSWTGQFRSQGLPGTAPSLLHKTRRPGEIKQQLHTSDISGAFSNPRTTCFSCRSKATASSDSATHTSVCPADTTVSRPALGPTQRPAQWVPGVKRSGPLTSILCSALECMELYMYAPYTPSCVAYRAQGQLSILPSSRKCVVVIWRARPGHYPEPVESSPYPHTLFNFNMKQCSMYVCKILNSLTKCEKKRSNYNVNELISFKNSVSFLKEKVGTSSHTDIIELLSLTMHGLWRTPVYETVEHCRLNTGKPSCCWRVWNMLADFLFCNLN
jgi:hypothetical protein